MGLWKEQHVRVAQRHERVGHLRKACEPEVGLGEE